MQSYRIRGLEVHDWTHVWDFEEVRKRLDFMVRNDLNTLVLHHVGVLDLIVYPAKFLGGGTAESIFDIYNQIDHNIYYHALRENLNLYRRDFLRNLIQEAAESGIEVYIEDKELWFKDFVLKYKPDLMNNGVLCPSDPFWYEEFLPEKYQELFVALPQLAGVVTSFGTGESRLAIANMFSCECERCKHLDPREWHKNMILGAYGPFKKAGKRLVIRDFIYSKEEQEQFADALSQIPGDVVISLKNTPHDFYPTFPDNPLIGNVGSREQWIEYDVNGQYFGWGIVPCIMLEDLEHRLRYGLDHGVTGYFMRTDWEGVQDVSCFDGPNVLNLYAAAALGKNRHADRRDIYEKWLYEEDLIDRTAAPAEKKQTVDLIASIFEKTWPLMRDAVYVNDTVFSDNSLFHVSLNQPQWVAETHHSLKNWFPDAKDALGLTEKNVAAILEEKDRALRRADEILRILAGGPHALKQSAYQDLLNRFEYTRLYVVGFRLETRLWVFARLLLENKLERIQGFARTTRELVLETLEELRTYAKSTASEPSVQRYPSNVLLNIERLNCFIRDVEHRLEEAGVMKPRRK